jgi:hypothetical protein
VLEGKENTLGVRNEKSGKLIYDEVPILLCKKLDPGLH